MIRLLSQELARRAARRVRYLYAVASVLWLLFAACVSLWSLAR